MTASTDMVLVARTLLMRDNRAFGQLVERYQSSIRRFFLHQTCGDAALSDDLAQDTFLKAYTHLDRFKQLSGFSTWLYRIACNVFYDYLRTHRKSYNLEAVDSYGGHCVVQPDVGNRMDLYRALSTLKEMERTCITLFYIDGLPIARIARIAGCPENTVKSHLKRAKEKLATYLKQNGYDQ